MVCDGRSREGCREGVSEEAWMASETNFGVYEETKERMMR